MRRTGNRGFTLVEVALSLVVLLMIVLVFAATFPLALRAASMGNNYNQAAFLAQHKIDQLRALGWGTIINSSLLSGASSTTDIANGANLDGTDPQIIDNNQTTAPWSFTTTDNLTSFFPTGSTGTLTITPDTNSPNCSPTVTSSCDVANVTVTITWSGGGLASGSYKTTAKIIKMLHR